MFNPKDLEYEVDHSFFDSDSDGEQNKLRAGAMDAGDRDCSLVIKGFHNSLKLEERQTDGKDLNYEGVEEQRHEEEDYGLCSTTANSVQSSPEREAEQEEESDGYNVSEEESEDESDKQPRSKAAPRKPSFKLRDRARSFSSRSRSRSESTGSSSESCSSDPHLPHASPPLPSHQAPRARLAAAEDSEDTVTDVTPLSTPDISPVQSFERVTGPREGLGHLSHQRNVSINLRGVEREGSEQEGERRSGLGSALGSVQSGVCSRMGRRAMDDVMDLNLLLKAFTNLETQEPVHINFPNCKSRRNFTFNSEEVRRIDRENQRLLRELSRPTPRSRPGTSSSHTRKPTSPPVRLYHSALNRQREQQRIERENLALLKRLESTKATPGMRRVEQLADYQRQAQYLGVPILPILPNRTSSRRSSSGQTSCHSSGSSVHRPRPVSDMSVATSMSSQAVEPREAWS